MTRLDPTITLEDPFTRHSATASVDGRESQLPDRAESRASRSARRGLRAEPGRACDAEPSATHPIAGLSARAEARAGSRGPESRTEKGPESRTESAAGTGPGRFRGDFAPLAPRLYLDLVDGALAEDLGQAGDVTTQAVVPPGARAEATMLARRPGRVCGLPVALAVFRRLDPDLEVREPRRDGDDVGAAEVLLRLRGDARALLAAERTALNLLGRLSGIATATRDLVRRVEDLPARIVCTRKTTPGLRVLEKYAVRVGGGTNHRFGLDDGVLIKDNHHRLAGGVGEAVRRARAAHGPGVPLEAEVETLAELDEALAAGADVLLLDNMPSERLAAAVARAVGRAVTEASGGVGPDTVREIAATGVDLVSVGWITHSAPALDVALEMAPLASEPRRARRRLVG